MRVTSCLPAFTAILRAPEDGGGGGAPETASPSPVAVAAPVAATPDAHAGVPATAAPEATAPEAPRRPDFIPEKFWDKEKNEPLLENAFTSYKELERRLHMRTDDLTRTISEEARNGLLKDRPESPDAYKLVPPDGFLPEGLSFEANGDDPLFKTFRQIAHNRGLGQEEVSQLIGAYLESQALQQVDPAQEIRALGAKAGERIATTKLWAQANIPKEFAAFVGADIAKTAQGIQFLEWVMKAAGEPRQGDLSVGGTSQSKGRLTAEQLTQMQGDPRYFDPMRRDPAFVKQIEDGWRSLVGN